MVKTVRYVFLSVFLVLPVLLSAQSECETPTGLTGVYFGPNFAILSWEGESNATYEVSYHLEGSGNSSTQTTTTNSITLSNLNTLSVYYAKVRKVCSNSQNSNYSSEYYFMTPSVIGGRVALNYKAGMTVNSQSGSGNLLAPLGQLMMNHSFVQTIIDSSFLSVLEDSEISYFGFHPINTMGGSYFYNMDVYMCNIPENGFHNYSILPDSNHVFHKVFSSADFTFSSTGWKVHQMDSTFLWDGSSNILVTVIGNNSNPDYETTADFASHYTTDSTVFCALGFSAMSLSDSNYMISEIRTYSGDIALMTCDGQECPSPTNLNASNITFESAVLSWNGLAPSCEVQYKSATDNDWSSSITVNGMSCNLTNLVESTNYYYRVRSICMDSEDYSDWVVGTFTTQSCNAPSNLTLNNVTYTTAIIDWTANNANQWLVHIWNEQYDSIYIATEHPFTITGLTPGTGYYIALSSHCSASLESEYSDAIYITTFTCNMVTGLTVASIGSNTVNLHWIGDGIGYDIEYGGLHFIEGINTTVEHCSGFNYTITGLQPEHSYSASVRAECEEGAYSDYCAQVDFTTLPSSEGIELTGATNIAIYPNPTSDATTISISGVTGMVEVSIVDMNGHIVRTEQMECSGDCTKQLQVNGLSQGAYLVQLKGEGVNLVRKLIVE